MRGFRCDLTAALGASRMGNDVRANEGSYAFDCSYVRCWLCLSLCAQRASPLRVLGEEAWPAKEESMRSLGVVFVIAAVFVPQVSFGSYSFLRGDSNGDGQLDIGDAISILSCLFAGGTCPACEDHTDANDDGAVDIGDPIYILQFLFANGSQPPPPYPDPGPDPTPDNLFCPASCPAHSSEHLVVSSDDCSAEDYAEGDADDDMFLKIFAVESLEGYARACLWIYGQAWNSDGHGFSGSPSHVLRINDHTEDLTFNSGAVYDGGSEAYSWAGIGVPIQLLKVGDNSFFISELATPNAHLRDNLRIGVDLDTDENRSWWFGNGRGAPGFNPFAVEGELLMQLELSPPAPPPPPSLFHIEPPGGPLDGGQTIEVHGANFTVGETTVVIGGKSVLNPEVISTELIRGVTPAGDAPGPVAVTVQDGNGVDTRDGAYTYGPRPLIEWVLPNAGPTGGGAHVLIKGGGLTEETQVLIDGIPLRGKRLLLVDMPDPFPDQMFLSGYTPPHLPGEVEVLLRNDFGEASRARGYAYVAEPANLSIEPSSGPAGGGTPVVIAGEGLDRLGAVTVAGQGMTDLRLLDADHWEGATPPCPAMGPADVVVDAPGGVATIPDGFYYNLSHEWGFENRRTLGPAIYEPFDTLEFWEEDGVNLLVASTWGPALQIEGEAIPTHPLTELSPPYRIRFRFRLCYPPSNFRNFYVWRSGSGTELSSPALYLHEGGLFVESATGSREIASLRNAEELQLLGELWVRVIMDRLRSDSERIHVEYEFLPRGPERSASRVIPLGLPTVAAPFGGEEPFSIMSLGAVTGVSEGRIHLDDIWIGPLDRSVPFRGAMDYVDMSLSYPVYHEDDGSSEVTRLAKTQPHAFLKILTVGPECEQFASAALKVFGKGAGDVLFPGTTHRLTIISYGRTVGSVDFNVWDRFGASQDLHWASIPIAREMLRPGELSFTIASTYPDVSWAEPVDNLVIGVDTDTLEANQSSWRVDGGGDPSLDPQGVSGELLIRLEGHVEHPLYEVLACDGEGHAGFRDGSLHLTTPNGSDRALVRLRRGYFFPVIPPYRTEFRFRRTGDLSEATLWSPQTEAYEPTDLGVRLVTSDATRLTLNLAGGGESICPVSIEEDVWYTFRMDRREHQMARVELLRGTEILCVLDNLTTRDADLGLPENPDIAIACFGAMGFNNNRNQRGDISIDDISIRYAGTASAVAAHGQADADGDGLSNAEEEDVYGTRTYETDSDDDGLSDFQEVRGWQVATYKRRDGSELHIREVTSDPNAAHSDSDGLSDQVEFERGLDPRKEDTDGDYLSDDRDDNPIAIENKTPVIGWSRGPVCLESFLGACTDYGLVISATASDEAAIESLEIWIDPSHQQRTRICHVTNPDLDTVKEITGEVTYNISAARSYDIIFVATDPNGNQTVGETHVSSAFEIGADVLGSLFGGLWDWAGDIADAYLPDLVKEILAWVTERVKDYYKVLICGPAPINLGGLSPYLDLTKDDFDPEQLKDLVYEFPSLEDIKGSVAVLEKVLNGTGPLLSMAEDARGKILEVLLTRLDATLPFDVGRVGLLLDAMGEPQTESPSDEIIAVTTQLFSFMSDSLDTLKYGDKREIERQKGNLSVTLSYLKQVLSSDEFKDGLRDIVDSFQQPDLDFLHIPEDLRGGESLVYKAGCALANSTLVEFELDITPSECSEGKPSSRIGYATVPDELRPTGFALKVDLSGVFDNKWGASIAGYVYLIDRDGKLCLGIDIYLSVGFPAKGVAVKPFPDWLRFGLAWPSGNSPIFCNGAHKRPLSGWGFSIGPMDYGLSIEDGVLSVVGTDLSWHVTTPTLAYSFLILSYDTILPEEPD